MDLEKTKKYEEWDRAFGFDPDKWQYKKWEPKHGSVYYLRDCPGSQISDPDLPF